MDRIGIIAQDIAMYDAMSRCFEFLSAYTIEHRSFLGMIFFFLFSHIECTKECVSLRTYLVYHTSIYIYITLETFFISTHTRFLSIVYFVHIIIIILRYERHLDFYQGILRISYSSNLFFNCVPMHLSFTKTVAIAIDSIRFEENRISNSKRA